MADPTYRYSVNEYPANGTQTEFEVSFAGGYIQREHVVVTVSNTATGASTDTPFTWVNDFTISITPAVAVGNLIRIQRVTPVGEPIVDYTDQAIINETTLDLSNKQAIFAAAEARDLVVGLPDRVTLTGIGAAVLANAIEVAATKDYIVSISSDLATKSMLFANSGATLIRTSTGATVEARFSAVETSDALKAPLANAALTGAPTVNGNAIQTRNERGAAGGYAPLGPDGLVPSSNLPVNGSYKGNWNASTNTPTITAGVGTNGDTYTVSVAGTQSITGTSTAFAVGDQARYTTNGNKWERIPNSAQVSSVAGKTGTVTLAKTDVGLNNVDNTADIDKPLSTAAVTALAGKQPTIGFTPANKAGETFGGAVGRDAQFYLNLFNGNPFLNFDAGDTISYNRTTDEFAVNIASAAKLRVSNAVLKYNNFDVYHGGNAGPIIRERANGETSDDAAFSEAIASLPSGGGTIKVPGKAYSLTTVPDWGTKSVVWDISPAASFTGAGTGIGKFPYMATNAGQMAAGPFIQSRSSLKSAHPNGGIAAFQAEMIQPANYGAGQSVAIYAGAIGGNPDPGGNVWALNTLVHAQPQAKGVYQSIEADANNDSPDASVKGISITGGGAYDAEVGLEVTRLAGSYWKAGVFVVNATDAIVVKGKTAGRGIVIQPPTATVTPEGNVAFSARQWQNSAGIMLFQRATDTAPTGYVFRFTDAANTRNITILGVDGTFSTEGSVRANNLKVFGPTPVVAASEVGFGNSTSRTATTGDAGSVPSQVAGYLVVNIGGTNYKLPYYNV